jgi:hypothetical protein
MNHSNNANFDGPYIKTGTLPVRWELKGDTATTLQGTCCSVQSEGGAGTFLGYEFSKSAGVITIDTGGDPIVALRPKATFNSLTNRSLIRLDSMFSLQTSAGVSLWELYYNATIVGGSWADVDGTYSGVQANIAGTSITGGIVVASWIMQSTNQQSVNVAGDVSSRYPLVLDAAGSQYATWALVATAITGTETVYGSLQWEEVR